MAKRNGWIGANSTTPAYVKADKTAAADPTYQIDVGASGTNLYTPTTVNGVPPGTHSIHITWDDVIQDPATSNYVLESVTTDVDLGTS